MAGKVKAWLTKDIEGTYFVSGTYLDDGQSPSTKFPKSYMQLQKKLDNLMPHLPIGQMKVKVSRIIKNYGYAPVIQVEN